MRECLSLRIKNDLLEIERMAQEVGAWHHGQALAQEVEYQVELALDELVSNAIRQGLALSLGFSRLMIPAPSLIVRN